MDTKRDGSGITEYLGSLFARWIIIFRLNHMLSDGSSRASMSMRGSIAKSKKVMPKTSKFLLPQMSSLGLVSN